MAKAGIAGIYAITNKENDKQYIGSSINLQCRWRDHRKDLRGNRHRSQKLQNAWNKYGEDAFIFEILEYIEDHQQLIAREQYYLDSLMPEYNIVKFASSQLGYRHREETKEKMRTRIVSLETREKLRQANIGQKRTEEQRARHSIAMNRPEAKERMRKALSTRPPMSEESRKRNREAIARANGRPEVREKNRQSHLGQIISAETRLKRSQKLKGLKRTPEQVERIREAQLRPEIREKKRIKQLAYWQQRRMMEGNNS